jgi:hypothetical protein
MALVLLVLLTAVPFSGVAVARQSDDIPVDLAAMVLRPSDFEAEGVAFAGKTRLPAADGEWNHRPSGHVVLPEAVQEASH